MHHIIRLSMHCSNGLKCFKLMPENDFICQNVLKCSKTAFDLLLNLIYVSHRSNVLSETRFARVKIGKLPAPSRPEPERLTES